MTLSHADVVVLGSANLDHFARVPAIPGPGETVLAAEVQRRAGGKGLNQAVAAARGGATTVFLGAVGRDDAGGRLLTEARDAGVDVDLVRTVDEVTGTAWITVRPDGENTIVVIGGANRTITALREAERQAIAGARVLAMQLETPLEAVAEAADCAADAGTMVVLNASPVAGLEPDLLGHVDVLVVNEHEARALGGSDELDGATAALRTRVRAVVVTLGADGAMISSPDGERQVPGVPADVVDTTGAGDTFAGVLAAALAAGRSLDDAVARAVVAGALAVEVEGALVSIPTAESVAQRLEAGR